MTSLLRTLTLAALAVTAVSCTHIESPAPLVVPVVAALYAETDSILFEGNTFLIDGSDHSPQDGAVLIGRTSVLGIATTGDPAKIENRLSHLARNNVEGIGTVPSIGHLAEGPDLDELAHRYAEAADTTVPGGAYADMAWGGLDDHQVVRVTGDLRVEGPVTGGGVLLVEGAPPRID